MHTWNTLLYMQLKLHIYMYMYNYQVPHLCITTRTVIAKHHVATIVCYKLFSHQNIYNNDRIGQGEHQKGLPKWFYKPSELGGKIPTLFSRMLRPVVWAVRCLQLPPPSRAKDGIKEKEWHSHSRRISLMRGSHAKCVTIDSNHCFGVTFESIVTHFAWKPCTHHYL